MEDIVELINKLHADVYHNLIIRVPVKTILKIHTRI